ncbi:hypothetical protein EVAR_19533_1 [Eumeta japonica]|uniref:Uncharacterized protein n=1 Tax=Eumeta variegata TaxID=151549 RepID=A0A4C1UEZ0_EUMVA|nr:hypothetical protein EVAR_19533_1 [Eumeta japonica]
MKVHAKITTKVGKTAQKNSVTLEKSVEDAAVSARCGRGRFVNIISTTKGARGAAYMHTRWGGPRAVVPAPFLSRSRPRASAGRFTAAAATLIPFYGFYEARLSSIAEHVKFRFYFHRNAASPLPAPATTAAPSIA